jgi:Phosphomannomutase
MERVADGLKADHDDVTTVDGVRVGTATGWALVRPSGTQLLIRVTAEADTDDAADRLAADAVERIEAARA